jgi:uncharacterized membrane protein
MIFCHSFGGLEMIACAHNFSNYQSGTNISFLKYVMHIYCQLKLMAYVNSINIYIVDALFMNSWLDTGFINRVPVVVR